MAKTYDEVIKEQEGKSIVMTLAELEAFHSDAFYAGHETSHHTPNISGLRKRDFVESDAFKRLRNGGLNHG